MPPLKQESLPLPLPSHFFNQLFISSTPLLQKKKNPNQTKPKIASVKENEPAFWRKLLAAYLPNSSLCQVRRQKWRIELAGDQLYFYSTSSVCFDESSWVIAKITKHCNIAFNCAKPAWSRAASEEEAGAGVPVPAMTRALLSQLYSENHLLLQICVWQNQGIRKAPVCLLRRALCSLKASASFQWVTTVHWSLSVIFSCCDAQRNRYSETASASANNAVQ